MIYWIYLKQTVVKLNCIVSLHGVSPRGTVVLISSAARIWPSSHSRHIRSVEARPRNIPAKPAGLLFFPILLHRRISGVFFHFWIANRMSGTIWRCQFKESSYWEVKGPFLRQKQNTHISYYDNICQKRKYSGKEETFFSCHVIMRL